jgi:hypothetical protein
MTPKQAAPQTDPSRSSVRDFESCSSIRPSGKSDATRNVMTIGFRPSGSSCTCFRSGLAKIQEAENAPPARFVGVASGDPCQCNAERINARALKVNCTR